MNKHTNDRAWGICTSLVAAFLFACVVGFPHNHHGSTDTYSADIVNTSTAAPAILFPGSNSPFCTPFQGYYICDKHPSGLSTVWWSQKLSKGRYEIFGYWEAIYPPKDRLATYRISPYREKEVFLTVNQKESSTPDFTVSAPNTKCSLPWCDGRMMNFQRLGEFSITKESATIFVGMGGKSDFSVVGHMLAIRRIGDVSSASSAPSSTSSSSSSSSSTSSTLSTGGSSSASMRPITLLDVTLTCQGTINVSFAKTIEQHCLSLVDEGTNILRTTVCGPSGTAWSLEQLPPITSLLAEGRNVVLTTGGSNAMFSLPIPVKKSPCTPAASAPAGTMIFDDADSNFSTMPSWNYNCSTLQDLRAYKGSHKHCPSTRLSTSIIAAPTGTWSIENLVPGTYDVYATWIPSKENGLNVSVSMANGIYPIGIGSMAQQNPPGTSQGFSIGSTAFSFVGSVSIPQSGKASITAIGAASDRAGRTSIDAIALVLRERSSVPPASSGYSSSASSIAPSSASSPACQTCSASQASIASSSIASQAMLTKRVVIDDSSTFGFTSTNNAFKKMRITNTVSIVSQPYKGTISLYAGASGETARFNVGNLPAGSYMAYATWPTSSTFTPSTNTEYQIMVGAINGTPVAKTVINQQSLPNETAYDGASWNAIGSFTLQSPSPVTIAVRSGNNTTFADAVMVVSTNGPTR